MDVSVGFLADLTMALALATLFGIVAGRLRINPILGYLAAGIVIGRFTPGYVANQQTVETLAQLGLIFLLFSLGLGFSVREIKALGARAIGGNLLVTSLGVVAASLAFVFIAFQHPWTAAITTAVSSTAVAVALLRGWKVEAEAPGHFTIAQQIVQDLAAVALLVVVTTPASSLSALGIATPVFKAAIFVVVALVLGATILQRIVRRIVSHAASETLFGAFSALALVAAWLGYVAGLSFEFGAFVAGAVISEAAGSAVVSSVVAPFRALFVTLFFVSVGMLIDLSFFASHWHEIVALGLLFAVLRFGFWFGLARVSSMTFAGAALVGVAMASLGEFNVVLVQEAERAHRLTPVEAQALLGITFVTMALSVLAGPLLSRLRQPWSRTYTTVDGESTNAARIAIVGFGRVGQTVASVFEREQIPFVALERNRATVESARASGKHVIHGDASDPVALDRLHSLNISAFLITLPETTTADIVTERLRARGDARVIARAKHPDDVPQLRRRGASVVIVPEVEGALRFAESALEALGEAPERIADAIKAERENRVW